MPAPVIVACAADTWVLVATSIIAGRVWIMDNTPTGYLHTYVATGGAAPAAGDLSAAVIAPRGNRDDGQPNLEVDYAELSDLYIYARGGAGSVRVDAGAGGGGFDAAIATSVASIDAKHGTTGAPADADGTRAAQLRYIAENIGSLRTIIEDGEDATLWAPVLDADAAADDTDHVTGTVAALWSKPDGTNILTGQDITLAAALDLSAYAASDYVVIALHIPDLTDVVSAALFLGTDNANYSRWNWEDTDLRVGWNFLAGRLSDIEAVAGTGMQQDAVVYAQIEIEFDAAGDLLAGMIIDHVAMVTADSLKPALDTGVVTEMTTRTTIATDDPQLGAVGAAADVDGNVHGQLRYLGEQLALLPPPMFNHSSPVDGSVAYTAAALVTAPGDWSFGALDDANCQVMFIDVFPNAGGVLRFINGSNGIRLTATAGALTIYGAAPFLANDDLYFVGVMAQKKGYIATDQAFRNREINPLDTRDDGEPVIDVTNLADNDVHPVYIPGQHKEHFAAQVIASDGVATDDIQVWFSETLEREADPAAVADWSDSDLLWGTNTIDNTTGAINRIDHVDTHIQATWYRFQYQRIAGAGDDGDLKVNWLDWW